MRLSLLICSALICAQASAQVMYRYQDEQGKQVISSTLPADASANGYEIISPRGNVIERVAPELTQEQIQAIEQDQKEAVQAEQRAQELEKAQQAERKKDTMLLKMFSHEQDIIRSKNEKVSAIEVQQSIMNENLKRLHEQLIKAEDRVKTLMSMDKVVPMQLKDTIAETKVQIHEHEDFVNRKEKEKNQIESQYKQMLDRFRKVKGLSTEDAHVLEP